MREKNLSFDEDTGSSSDMYYYTINKKTTLRWVDFSGVTRTKVYLSLYQKVVSRTKRDVSLSPVTTRPLNYRTIDIRTQTVDNFMWYNMSRTIHFKNLEIMISPQETPATTNDLIGVTFFIIAMVIITIALRSLKDKKDARTELKKNADHFDSFAPEGEQNDKHHFI